MRGQIEPAVAVDDANAILLTTEGSAKKETRECEDPERLDFDFMAEGVEIAPDRSKAPENSAVQVQS